MPVKSLNVEESAITNDGFLKSILINTKNTNLSLNVATKVNSITPSVVEQRIGNSELENTDMDAAYSKNKQSPIHNICKYGFVIKIHDLINFIYISYQFLGKIIPAKWIVYFAIFLWFNLSNAQTLSKW